MARQRRVNTFADDAVPAELANSLACVSNFLPGAQATPLPAVFSDGLRARGLSAHGPVTLGRFPVGLAAPADPLSAVADLFNTWERGSTLRVGFLDRNAGFEDRVRTHVKKWSEAGDIKFQFVTNAASAQIRITFLLTDSFSSLVGKEALQAPAGQHTMSLGFRATENREDEFSRLVLHEFGHAIGLMHEHQNPLGGIQWNFNVAIPYYRQRIRFPDNPPENVANARIQQQLSALPNSSRFNATPFDGKSVMLYKIEPQLVMPGTFRPEFGNNNTELSDTDKQIAADLYGTVGPPPPPPSKKLRIDGPSKDDGLTDPGERDVYEFDVTTTGVYQAEATGDVLLRVALADAAGTPLPGFLPGDSLPGLPLRVPFFLTPGSYTLLVTASQFLPNAVGSYNIRLVTRA